MSEENTNDVTPAVLAEGEAVIPAEKVEEFKAVVDEILEASPAVEAAEPAAEPVVEEPAPVVEDKAVIASTSENRAKPSDFAAGLTGVVDGVIGTGAVKRKPVAKKEEKATTDKVAIHSTKNVSWPGIGKVFKGTNIVSREQADKWLTRDHVTLVSPEQVAQELSR